MEESRGAQGDIKAAKTVACPRCAYQMTRYVCPFWFCTMCNYIVRDTGGEMGEAREEVGEQTTQATDVREGVA